MQPVSPGEEQQILDALIAGQSQNAVAKQFGRGCATVNRIAKANGLEYSAPKNAIEARVDYCAAERLKLLNAGFDKALELLPHIDAPQPLQQWTVAVGTLIDKRRLEDGEATSRSEVSDHRDDARARLAGRLDELATRRRARPAAG